eukprot:jgi/Botrbrau1/15367/Bobra.0304s0008.1
MTNKVVHLSPGQNQDETAQSSSQLVSVVDDHSNVDFETVNTSATILHSNADSQLASAASAVSSECSGTIIDLLQREDSEAFNPRQDNPDCVPHETKNASSGGGHGVLSREGRRPHHLLHLTIQTETGSLPHQNSLLLGLSLTPNTSRGNVMEGHLSEGSPVEAVTGSSLACGDTEAQLNAVRQLAAFVPRMLITKIALAKDNLLKPAFE